MGTIVNGVGAIRLITLAPAVLRAMMMVRLFGQRRFGQRGALLLGAEVWGRLLAAGRRDSGLLGGYLADGIASNGPRIIRGIKSGFEGLTEPGRMFGPGGMFGPPEFAPAGVPGGFGMGGDPAVVPRSPGSPGMDAWNPPKN